MKKNSENVYDGTEVTLENKRFKVKEKQLLFAENKKLILGLPHFIIKEITEHEKNDCDVLFDLIKFKRTVGNMLVISYDEFNKVYSYKFGLFIFTMNKFIIKISKKNLKQSRFNKFKAQLLNAEKNYLSHCFYNNLTS